jgi:hypothetical protein
MPFENKELSRALEIIFIECTNRFPGQNSGWVLKTEFRVVFPNGNECSIGVIFDRGFIEDKNYQEDLFKKMGLVKIEEYIDEDLLTGDIDDQYLEIRIRLKDDLDWVEKIEQGILRPSSKEINGAYFYTPQRRIGFK